MPEFIATGWNPAYSTVDIHIIARNYEDAYRQAQPALQLHSDLWHISLSEKDEQNRTVHIWTFVDAADGRQLRSFREIIHLGDGYRIIHYTRYKSPVEYECTLVHGRTAFVIREEPFDELMNGFVTVPQEYVLTDTDSPRPRRTRLFNWIIDRVTLPWNVYSDDGTFIWSFSSAADCMEAKLLFA